MPPGRIPGYPDGWYQARDFFMAHWLSHRRGMCPLRNLGAFRKGDECRNVLPPDNENPRAHRDRPRIARRSNRLSGQRRGPRL
jgi:hypothetical protein